MKFMQLSALPIRELRSVITMIVRCWPNNFTASSVQNRGWKALISNPDVPRHSLLTFWLCLNSALIAFLVTLKAHRKENKYSAYLVR